MDSVPHRAAISEVPCRQPIDPIPDNGPPFPVAQARDPPPEGSVVILVFVFDDLSGRGFHGLDATRVACNKKITI